MSEKKNLMINCDVCDARNAKKEYLSDFEQILINTDLLLVSAESRGILEQLPAICNTDNTLEVDDSVILLFHSGDSVISGGTALQENTVLAVNGNLTIRSDASREVLNSLRAVNVTGSLLCPVSLLSCLKDLYVTGDVKTYPDDCIVMDPIFTPDAYFHLRAKEGQKYYAEQEVRFTSPGIHLTTLKEKNVRFVSPRFFVPEEKAADALELFDETAFMEAIPDGYAFVGKDTELDEKLLAQYGNRLFIRGNVTLTEKSAPLLPGLEKLYVAGTLYVPEELKEDFRRVDAQCGLVEIIKKEKRRVLENRPRVVLDKVVLDASPKGLLVRNCAVLTIREDVPPQGILDHVDIMNCARVDCTEEQKAAVQLKSTNVAQIGSREENGEPRGMLGVLLNLSETKMINADKYVL